MLSLILEGIRGINVQRELTDLVTKFDSNLAYYKDDHNRYNESATRTEYIDPFLRLLGWDISNTKGLVFANIKVDRISVP